MSVSLLERLKVALADHYEIERELGTGGMGTVFLARDVTLERSVAIKMLRPELATAVAAERFVREARILARLSHPNVVPIHDAGEVDGLFYYVMDCVQGETLDKRLERGPLREDDVVRLGRDLLAALEAAHGTGVIHRDVKPSNVFLVEGRALLGDFGVAKPVEEGQKKLTTPGRQPGTPDYMPPEQIGGQVTPRTDLYAVGMVLFEAATGKRWSVLKRTDDADWTGVPGRLARVLRRGLAWSPEERWEDAPTFRRALLQKAGRRGRAATLRNRLIAGAIAIAVVAAGYFALKLLLPQSLVVERDLAVLPVEIQGEGSEQWDGTELARLVTTTLEGAPDVRIVSPQEAFAWWDSAAGVAGPPAAEQAANGLRARYAARVVLVAEGDSLNLLLDVFDRSGRPLPGLQRLNFRRVSLLELSDSISLRLLQTLFGDDLPEDARLTSDAEAASDFLHGERAFENGELETAVAYYEAAVARDSSFALAWWHLANAWRWVGRKGPYPYDFRHVFEQYAADLGPVDSLLMEAQLTQAGEERFDKYREAAERDPLNYFAAFLRGEEMFGRGALWGQSLEDAVDVLETAIELNPQWALAHVHLIWANIRLGNDSAAAAAFDRLPRIAADPDEGWLYPPELLQQAYYERFDPQEAAQRRQLVFADTTFGSPEGLAMMSRLGGAFDLPFAQVEFGTVLVETADPFRAAGYLVRGLGRVALGREAAFADFDSAAALFDNDEARLMAAEWRVLPQALGMPLGSAQEHLRGRQALETLVAGEAVGARAAWALTMDAYAADDPASARRWASVAAEDAALTLLLRAMEEASGERYDDALAVSQPLLAIQGTAISLSGTPTPSPPLSDAFLRAALHLKRGEWYEALGDTVSAEREWLWYEAVDVDGLPTVELPLPGEIDWSLGNYGRYLRGRSNLQRGEFDAACRHLGRAAEVWSGADPELAELLQEARRGAAIACGQGE
jgi:tetratricopeptide (TPR) repeat protein